MTKFPLLAGIPAAGLLLLTGCVDDNYDLSDIDTTSEIRVNNLVLPLNLKPVTLDKVIDVDDDDPDATIIKWPKNPAAGEDQYYAVRKTGEFHSNPSTIDRVETSEPDHIDGTEQEVYGTPVTGALVPGKRKASGDGMKYAIGTQHTTFDYKAHDVDPAIKTIEATTMQAGHLLYTTVTLTSPDVATTAEKVRFVNLSINIPLGMNAQCEIDGQIYRAEETVENGERLNLITLPTIEENGNVASLVIETDYIDFTEDSKHFSDKGIEVVNGTFNFTAEIGVHSGDLIVFPKSDTSVSALPTSMKFLVDYDMTAFTVDRFSGELEYAADIDDIDPVDLSDLPDFLAGEETNLIMSNPEISLQVNNPVAENLLSCKSGLSITPLRNGVRGNSCDLPSDFIVGHDKGEGPYAFILAPDPSKAVNPNNYANPDRLVYPSLGQILAGKGLPTSLNIDLSNANTPEPMVYGDAQNFQLGEPIHSVDGSYCFFTPLALAKDSRIVYDTTEDGWDSEDLQDLVIESMAVMADATSDLPCVVTISMRPLDKNGNTIPILNPDLAKTTIPANANDDHIEIQLDGDQAYNYISGLDGLHIIATAEFADNDGTLTPAQNIKLSNLRLRVNGKYVKEF